MLLNPSLSHQDIKQQQLAQHCFWDEEAHILWIDCRKVFPELGVIQVPCWDDLMMSSAEIPEYPSHLNVLAWYNFSQLSCWRKQIPKWVQESCALFPSHQLKMLHYVGKYPQMLELLDHVPMLVWRLMCSVLTEPEMVALLSGKRQNLVAQVGWPERAEAVTFLRNLRLRKVNEQIADQVEVCLMDEQRLTALQSLPRINSMALSLASMFPELIGSHLHCALAQLPCRPMQCQSMVALLQDAYALAKWLDLPESEVAKIGLCRYLVEVTSLYQGWLKKGVSLVGKLECEAFEWSDSPVTLSAQESVFLSQLQQHAWWVDDKKECLQLVAWQDTEGVWGALIESPPCSNNTHESPVVLRVRGEKNTLPSAKQLSALHLWLADNGALVGR
ncbi:hypothetical protein MNBD_GAMMA04-1016 [hydrothermal vent metagenome]|uniref:Uncharacterized protein n=1 Tax=hydrothermal vent metagenome TaxID=652676 RepID=A0A3B0VX56_9ZZZZ